ncbi:MAG: N-acetylmuramoyl-L-alanine amidase, partial [Ignavibacteria bacterium]|nr:N-acetylmuramoyl-L-alanine amidase [Ignavibacteria bacterium]
MRSYLIIFFISLLFFQTLAQDGNNVLVVTKDGMKNIPAYVREGTVYFSLKDFADVVGVNYYYNEDAQKIEVKFDKYFLKASARNPFFVLSEKNGDKQFVIQLPTSAYLISNKVFIPLIYSLKAIEQAYGKELKYDAPNKIVIGKIKEDISKTNEEKSSTFNIHGIILNEKANGTLITVKSNKRIPSYLSAFKNNILTLTFRKVTVDVEKVKFIASDGVVKKIEAKNVGTDAVINITVGKEYTTNEVMNIEKSNDIQITVHNKLFKKENSANKLKEKWEFDVIVIDAGHGGKDAGAIGVNGVKEKDINLSIALKLGKLIEENMKDVKVVNTRKTDKFIDLYKRGKIANENNGKLFISIHCNSTPKKPSDAKGFEVYLLRPGRTKEAISIAEFENSVIQYEE